MKQGIHPTYHEDAVISCACGATYQTGSTNKELAVEICAACHPFYTGKKKYIDSTGRVERFKQLSEKAKEKQAISMKRGAKSPKRTKSGKKEETPATAEEKVSA